MMTNSNEDGVDKVLANRGGYVYIMESVSVDYEVSARLQSDIFSYIWYSDISDLNGNNKMPFFLRTFAIQGKDHTVQIFLKCLFFIGPRSDHSLP